MKIEQPALYAGIDPGALSGTVCVINQHRQIVFKAKLPSVKKQLKGRNKKSGKNKSRTLPSVKGYLDLFKKIAEMGIVLAVVEEIGPLQGARMTAANHSLAASYFLIQMALMVAGIKFKLVEVDVWQDETFTEEDLKYEKKERDLSAARRIFPHHAEMFEEEGDHNASDAAIFADLALKHSTENKNERQDTTGRQPARSNRKGKSRA